MRRLFLVLTILAISVMPAHAVKPVMKDNDSPQLKQCLLECKKEKDATAQENCNLQCIHADKEKNKQSDAASGRK